MGFPMTSARCEISLDPLKSVRFFFSKDEEGKKKVFLVGSQFSFVRRWVSVLEERNAAEPR